MEKETEKLLNEIYANIKKAYKDFGTYAAYDGRFDEIFDVPKAVNKIEQLPNSEIHTLIVTLYKNEDAKGWQDTQIAAEELASAIVDDTDDSEDGLWNFGNGELGNLVDYGSIEKPNTVSTPIVVKALKLGDIFK